LPSATADIDDEIRDEKGFQHRQHDNSPSLPMHHRKKPDGHLAAQEAKQGIPHGHHRYLLHLMTKSRTVTVLPTRLPSQPMGFSGRLNEAIMMSALFADLEHASWALDPVG
jgi:hypothetical protein